MPLYVRITDPVDAEGIAYGPLLMISGYGDHTESASITRVAYERQKRNKQAVTEFVQPS